MGPYFSLTLMRFDTSPDILVHLLVCVLSRARPVLHARSGGYRTVHVLPPSTKKGYFFMIKMLTFEDSYFHLRDFQTTIDRWLSESRTIEN